MSGGLRSIIRGDSHFDVVGRRRRWAAISGAVLLLSLIGLFVSKLNLGQEFTGGTSFKVTVPAQGPELEVGDVEGAIAAFNLQDVKVQIQEAPDPDSPGTTQQQILVRSGHVEPRDLRRVQDALAEVAGVDDPDQVSIEDVGPTWGEQVSSKALRGLIIFLILVSIYISLRFEWKMALAAIAALVHDLVATAGVYALVGFVVTPATVVALLTLLGYSLYDTVVVFDKIQENTATLTSSARATYSEMVNRSVNQVMMRSINTSLSTILPIGALLFVGVYLFQAETLKDLALAMFIGTLVGTYSSIFVASPLLAVLKERESRYRAIAARIGREARTAAPAATPHPAAAETAAETTPETTAEEQAPPIPPRPTARTHAHRPGGPKPRKRRRGKRR